MEQVLMLGAPAAIAAARDWRHAAWHLEWLARGLRTDAAEYTQTATESGLARRRFYQAVRADLGIAGGEVPEIGWPPSWQQAAQPPDPVKP
jgi:hypothetical protein